MIKDITGKKFGRLTAIKWVSTGFWLFKCACGKETVCRGSSARSGGTRSCGCLRGYVNRTREQKRFSVHGLTSTRFYQTWQNMKQRCNNPRSTKFQIYGARGIKCLWKSFDEFKNDMYESYKSHIHKLGEKDTTIERINNNGHYCKENCRWATLIEQARNRRDNVIVHYDNKKMTIPEWSEFIGINPRTLRARILFYNWPIEMALTKNVR